MTSTLTPNLPYHSHRKVNQVCYGEKWNEHPRREKEQIGGEIFGISCYVQISDQDHRRESDVEATKYGGSLHEQPP